MAKFKHPPIRFSTGSPQVQAAVVAKRRTSDQARATDETSRTKLMDSLRSGKLSPKETQAALADVLERFGHQ